MKVGRTVEQIKGGEKAKQTIYVVTMQVADENMVYFAKPDLVAPKLDLCTFTTINQKQPLIYIKYMSGKVPFRCW